MRLYYSLPVEVCLFWCSSPKLELESERFEYVSVDEDPNKELSEGTCQDGNVESGLGTVFTDTGFVADLGLFVSLT